MPTRTRPATRPVGARPLLFSVGAALALLTIVVVLALGGVDGFGNNRSTAGPSESSPGRAVAPDFRVVSLDGKTFQLSAARGKVVALYFAAAWCPTCIPEAQAWTQIYQRYHSRGLEVVMLDVDSAEGASHWADFRQRTGDGPQLWALDQGLSIASSYGVTSLETSILIDRQGRIAERHRSTVPLQQLQEEVERLL